MNKRIAVQFLFVFTKSKGFRTPCLVQLLFLKQKYTRIFKKISFNNKVTYVDVRKIVNQIVTYVVD